MRQISKYLIIFSCIQSLFAYSCLVTNFEDVSNATANCLNIDIVDLTVPAGQMLYLDLLDGATVTFKGNTTFEFYDGWTNTGPLAIFNGSGVTIQGDEDHIFDPQGALYWDGLGDWGLHKPHLFYINTYRGSVIKNFYVLNPPHYVLLIYDSDSTTISNWFIDSKAGDEGVAPAGKEAYNTDGFDLWNSTNILIKDSVVFNQDDCVALRCGSNITVQNLECHGTHGLSMSVGFSNDSVLVDNPWNTLTNVHFANSSMYGGLQAIHIKIHNEAGYGLLENVLYENIYTSGAKDFGILIEQNYPFHGEPSNRIPIKNLTIINVYGDVREEAMAVSVTCADGACNNWYWENINITGSKLNNNCNYKPEGSTVCD